MRSFKSFAKRRRQRDSNFGVMRGDVGAAPDGSIIDEQASRTMKKPGDVCVIEPSCRAAAEVGCDVQQAAEEAKAGSSTGDSSDTSDSEEHKRAADGTLVAVEHRATGAALPCCCLPACTPTQVPAHASCFDPSHTQMAQHSRSRSTAPMCSWKTGTVCYAGFAVCRRPGRPRVRRVCKVHGAGEGGAAGGVHGGGAGRVPGRQLLARHLGVAPPRRAAGSQVSVPEI